MGYLYLFSPTWSSCRGRWRALACRGPAAWPGRRHSACTGRYSDVGRPLADPADGLTARRCCSVRLPAAVTSRCYCVHLSRQIRSSTRAPACVTLHVSVITSSSYEFLSRICETNPPFLVVRRYISSYNACVSTVTSRSCVERAV